MKRFFTLIIGLSFASSIFSQTQTEINEDSFSRLNNADKQLNIVYNRIIDDYKNDSAFIEKLRISQRQWIKFRDAEVEMRFPEYDKQLFYGSMFPMCKADYLTILTKERTRKLKEWLKPKPDGEGCGGSIMEREIDKSQITIEKIDEIQIIKLVNELKILTEFRTNDLSIRIIELGNAPGSAGFDNGEITNKLFIAISEFGEYPKQSLFELNEFYNAQIVDIDKTDSKQPILSISYGNSNNKKIIKIKLTIDEIKACK